MSNKDDARSKKVQLIAEDFCKLPSNETNLLFLKEYYRFCYYNNKEGYWEIFQNQNDFFYPKIYSNYFVNITESWLTSFIFNASFHCKNRRDNYYSDYIALADCLLNTTNFALSEFDSQKYPFYKLNITRNQVDNIDEPIPDSRFKQFIHEILINEDTCRTEESLVMLVQEMFGYCLSDDISSEATFFLLGDQGANGKGVLMYILQKMIGEQFCDAINLKKLTGDKFAFGSLVGKKLNIAEENEGESIDSSTLKTLVSGDAISVEEKFAKSFRARLQIKYIFTTNSMPKFTNFDNALKRRLFLIPFNRHFKPEERDYGLKKKLESEMSIIALWALQGLKRLIQNNFHFTACEISQKIVEEEQEDNNSCVQFLREYYEEDERGKVKLDDLYLAYTIWCKDCGRKPSSKQRVGKDFSKLLKLKSFVSWDNETQNTTRYLPLSLKQGTPPKLEF